MSKCARPNCPNKGYRGKMQGFCTGHYEHTAVKGLVDPKPVRVRLDVLRSKGWGFQQLAVEAGMTPQGLWLIYQDGHLIQRATLERIMCIPIPETLIDRGGLVPAVGSARRLKALSAIGYTQDDLAARMDSSQKRLGQIIAQSTVTAATALRVAKLFDELAMLPGPSRRSRVLAKRRGWAPPLAFDDIDDPAEHPASPVEASVSWIEKYTELRDLGVPESRIPERMGIDAKSVERQLIRLGLFKGAA